jgi:hypothetical protein
LLERNYRKNLRVIQIEQHRITKEALGRKTDATGRTANVRLTEIDAPSPQYYDFVWGGARELCFYDI